MKRFAGFTSVAVLLALSAAAKTPAGAQDVPEEFKHQAEPGEDHTSLWKLANFVLLAGALGYFIYKRGGPFFASRTSGIRRGLAEAARLKQEAEARYAEIERRLANIGLDIENLRRRARQESSAEGERVRLQTEFDLRKIQAQAEQEIAAAAKAARQELRAYSAELAVGLAEQKIRERLTPEAENDLIESVVTGLEQQHARQQAVRVP